MHIYPDRIYDRLHARLHPLRALVLCSACLLLACAARPQPTAAPLKTITRYRDALDRDDPKAAYALLAKTVQQGLPYEQFAQQWQETKEERRAQLAQLRQPPAAGAVKARALVTLPQGTQLVLEPAAAAPILLGKPSAWHILDPDLQVLRAQTPEAVLRLLLTAAEQRNYPALLRLLTRAERQSLEAELSERIERLRTSLARSQAAPPGENPPENSPARTRIQYDPRFFIDLKREPEGWRIADFN